MSSHDLAQAVIAAADRKKLRIGTAESCTGGLVAGALTAVAGSSSVMEGGVVSYSNRLKEELLGVDPALIAAHGAVSAEVALAMAQGALARLGIAAAVSITGIAGPGGGSVEKPVGLVYFCALGPAGASPARREFGAIGRDAVRAGSVDEALSLLLAAIGAD